MPLFMTAARKPWQYEWVHAVIKFCLLMEMPHTGCAALANAGIILVSIPWCNDWLAVSAKSSRPDLV